MKKISILLLMGSLLWTSHSKGQVILQALDAPDTQATFHIPDGVTLLGNIHYISSVRDNEYLPYIPTNQPATWDAGQTNGNDPMIDVQGKIPTEGIEVMIPYEVSGSVSGNIGAYRQEVTVPATRSSNNTPGTLILEWEETSVNSTGGFIRAKLKAKNTTFFIKQLDLEKGLGNDQQGVELTYFTYFADNEESIIESFSVRVMSGIPDKKFGITTYSPAGDTNEYRHQFLYLPVLGNDGKWWLNNNLGADYAKIGNTYFNPNHQAGARETNGNLATNIIGNHTQYDYRAYGSLFQWGRKADGHELMDWDNLQQPRRAINSIYPYSDAAQLSIFNEVCPLGWHTPTQQEYQNLVDIAYTGDVLQDNPLRFPFAGYYDGNVQAITQRLHYWTSTSEGTDDAHFLWGYSRGLNIHTGDKREMRPIRCVKGNPSTVIGNIPSGITLRNYTHFVASIYDNDYLPYTLPTAPADWTSYNAGGGTDPLIDVQGKITTQGTEILIPIETTGTGTIPAGRFTTRVPASKTEDGQARTLELSWNDTPFTNNTHYITATLKSLVGDLNVKKLDVNRGVGNDYKGVELATFNININTPSTVTVRAMVGVPDKKFGIQTNGRYEHDFIYLPMQGPDGRIWLNNNLGAGYSNITSPYFNPNRQAGALDYTDATTNAQTLTNPTAEQIKRDWRAYGYLYEWRRDSDGHEVVEWNLGSQATYTQAIFMNPNLHNNSNAYNPSTFGEPCPSGFRTSNVLDYSKLWSAMKNEVNHYNGTNTNNIWEERRIRLSLGIERKNLVIPQSGVVLSGFDDQMRYWTRENTRKLFGIFKSWIAWEITLDNARFLKGGNQLLNQVTMGIDGYQIRCIAD